MSAYDEMPTGELLSVLPGVVARDRDEALGWAAAMRDRLATYERIVAELRAMRSPINSAGMCALCGGAHDQYGRLYAAHEPFCPWWLAQQTGSGTRRRSDAETSNENKEGDDEP